MCQLANRQLQEDDRNPFEEMSFREAFESAECRQLLENIRPNMVCPTVLLSGANKKSAISLSALLLEDSDMDEELIVSRFRDCLWTLFDKQEENGTSIPGVVLEEFLNALGPQEPQFWRKLPMVTIFRVTDGVLPITPKLSAQLSRVLGTRSKFWFEMQIEYDRWKSGLIRWEEADTE
jgi:plasmid maintenance system antidote protein VapI